MRLTKLAATALAIAGLAFATGCSKEEGDPSFVSEAQAASAPAQKDYGWRTNPDFPAKQDDVREYY
jgi:hypothetical protein